MNRWHFHSQENRKIKVLVEYTLRSRIAKHHTPLRPGATSGESIMWQIGAATGESLRIDVFFASPVPDHYVQTWRRPQNRKYITYRNATEKNRATALGNLHKKIGCVIPEVYARGHTYKHTQTHTDRDKQTSQYSTRLQEAELKSSEFDGVTWAQCVLMSIHDLGLLQYGFSGCAPRILDV